MRPIELSTKILLDGGDQHETEEVMNLLGFLDGQTTNPSLITKNPEAQERLAKGDKFSKTEIYDFYKKVVEDISQVIPQGSISIEVYADKKTKAAQMIKQAEEMNQWIPNPFIKLPFTLEGLKAAEKLCKKMRINMTLCFSQEQAAAVYAATKNAEYEIYVSPFIGRLDDKNIDGIDLIIDIQRMYAHSDHHVKVLAASIRDISHLLYIFFLKTDITTVPFEILKQWQEEGMKIPGVELDPKIFADKADYFQRLHEHTLTAINYKELDLNLSWTKFNIESELTDAGINKFSKDWNNLIKS